MPYFHCYKDLIHILPIKSKLTLATLREYWSKYKILHHEELNKYLTVLRKDITETNKINEIVCKEQIDITKLKDFINNNGSYYLADQNDEYVKEKMKIKDDSEESTTTQNEELDYSDDDDDTQTNEFEQDDTTTTEFNDEDEELNFSDDDDDDDDCNDN